MQMQIASGTEPSHETTPIGVSVNFDSMGEALGFPKGFKDPSYFSGYDRIVELAARENMPLTFYLIGRDLENPEVHARVKDWASAGHEIGSHSYSHHMNLGALPVAQIEEELNKAHSIIGEATGSAPEGFIAPAWASSRRVIAHLISLGYTYDTSLFPSAALWAMCAKIAWNHRSDPGRRRRAINRRDWFDWLSKPRTAFLTDSQYRPQTVLADVDRLVVLPLPSRNRLSIPVWHTKGFMFGWEQHAADLQQLLTTFPYFYYVIHPADVLDADDLPSGHAHALERMNVPVSEKLARLGEVFSQLAHSRREMLAVRGLARHFRRNKPT